MTDENQKTPTDKDVRLIFKDTYNFYLEWKDITSDEDWIRLTEKRRQLCREYPFELCKKIMIGIVELLEIDYKRKRRK